jgi:uncharacterized heparinase superfamily protein
MKLLRLYHTLRYLRVVQWTDRVLRHIKAGLLRERRPTAQHLDNAIGLPQANLPRFLTTDSFDLAKGLATFLNVSHSFGPGVVDWNLSERGKLWAYHLNYFGWLEQIDAADQALAVMRDFCRRTKTSAVGAEPYPSSRRIQHWIGVMLRHELHDQEVLARLYRDAYRVVSLPERHLQGNHLLQNGFAIFAAAHFFEDKSLYRSAQWLLKRELRSQVLPDGAHIERSASYTADLCARTLWCLHLQKVTQRFEDIQLTNQLRNAAGAMLSWLSSYAFSDNSLAAIGDSSTDMMPPLSALREAASSLGIFTAPKPLRESGYRKASGKNWEAVINVGNPSPVYQPGHSHADALSFCIHAHGKPLVVDTGISTYEQCARRALERSTSAHNTVEVNGQNSSDVWASFRIGKRAKIRLLEDEHTHVTAEHDGYRRLGVSHRRTFDWSEADALCIEDHFPGAETQDVVSYLHFHPEVQLQQREDGTWQASDCRVILGGMTAVAETYQWAAGFNLLRTATRLRCTPLGQKTEIRLQF